VSENVFTNFNFKKRLQSWGQPGGKPKFWGMVPLARVETPLLRNSWDG